MTKKQMDFANEYMKNGGNVYKSAIDAGYSKNTAINGTRDILEKPCVSEHIAEQKERIDKEKNRDIMI